MGYDLTGAGGYFRFGAPAWGKVLSLAYEYGWQPAGTLAPEGNDDWDGSYLSNAGPLVSEIDAAGIGSALSRALADVSERGGASVETPPDMAVREDQFVSGFLAMINDIFTSIADAKPFYLLDGTRVNAEELAGISPLRFFAGADGRDKIRGFIAYCGAGKFKIE